MTGKPTHHLLTAGIATLLRPTETKAQTAGGNRPRATPRGRPPARETYEVE